MLEKCIKAIDDGSKDIVISFDASNEKLRQKEIRYLSKGADLSFIRGTVRVMTLIDNDFGFPNWKVHRTEKNVSFGRFKSEIIDKIPNNFKIGDIKVFPRY